MITSTDDLTTREGALIEELSGQPLGALNDPDKPKMKQFAALVLVIRRREGEPKLTFNAVLDQPMKVLAEFLQKRGLIEGDSDDDEADTADDDEAVDLGESERSDESAPE